MSPARYCHPSSESEAITRGRQVREEGQLVLSIRSMKFGAGLLAVAAISMVLAGCGSRESPTTSAGSTPAAEQYADPDVSNVWHESAVFDPNSELGTFVRAYYEAMTLPADSVEVRFPGTTEASRWQYAAMRTSVESDSYYTHAPETKGTQDHYVVWDNQSGDTVDVGICTSKSRLAVRGDDGRWYVDDGRVAVKASRMWITTSGRGPRAAVSGDSAFPYTDVYGDWTVSRYDIVADHQFGQGPPHHRPTDAACTTLLGLDPAGPGSNRTAVRGEPVVKPNSPGWPSVGKA